MTEVPRLICILPIGDVPQQLIEWADLRVAAHEVSPLHNGVALRLPGELESAVRDLAARESECCSFLTVRVARAGDEVHLEITSDVAGAAPVIAAIVGSTA